MKPYIVDGVEIEFHTSICPKCYHEFEGEQCTCGTQVKTTKLYQCTKFNDWLRTNHRITAELRYTNVSKKTVCHNGYHFRLDGYCIPEDRTLPELALIGYMMNYLYTMCWKYEIGFNPPDIASTLVDEIIKLEDMSIDYETWS